MPYCLKFISGNSFNAIIHYSISYYAECSINLNFISGQSLYTFFIYKYLLFCRLFIPSATNFADLHFISIIFNPLKYHSFSLHLY